VRCPWCGVDDDRVVDSRQAEEGGAIRRRRECLGCGRRFTTFERVEDVPLWVVKRNGLREPFDRNKVVEGVRAACKNRPVSDLQMEELAQSVEDALRAETTEPTSEHVGVAVLDRLQALDDVAYLRFASVYKGFEEAGDFQREARILTKTTEPKRK
jgi:transcriptional repressor NrdR